MIDLSILNSQQLEAVKFKNAPLMIVAAAGGGKTLSLTYRIARILESGALPGHVFVSTFTKKAAEEMIERLNTFIGKAKTKKLNIGTFHSLCFKIYRKSLQNLKPGKELPKLLKGGGQWMVVKYIMKNNNCVIKDVKCALNQISHWKNLGLTPEFVSKSLESQSKNNDHTNNSDIAHCFVYKEYEEYLKKNNSIDFDSMLFNTYHILKKNKSELRRVQKRIEYILIDEFQDMNRIQYMLLDQFAGKKRNITLTGDDFQSIFRFRGSMVEYLFDFQKKYSATIFKLEQNYRSTKAIVELGNKLIVHNTNQIKKTLFTDNFQGEKSKLLISSNPDSEAIRILGHIDDLVINQGYNFSDIAILYRINSQSRAIVDEFVKNNVPHKVHSNYSFYERNEIKDILSYIKILCNPFLADDDDFKRILNRPNRYLGNDVIKQLGDLQYEKDYETFWQALQNHNKLNLKSYQHEQIGYFVRDIIKYESTVSDNESTTQQIIDLVLYRIGYMAWVNQETSTNDPDNDSSLNVNALYDGAERFVDPLNFLSYIEAMKTQVDEDDAVQCMTIHKSKGLEYPVVFVIGLSENLLPFYKAIKEDGGLEEERRICYVAITRAKELLYLSSIDGKFNKVMVNKPSRFLTEMGITLPELGEGVEYN